MRNDLAHSGGRLLTGPGVLRFAPTPNGRLHLGHAYSALFNAALRDKLDGRLLLRFEDTDPERCRPAHETAILDDLAWLGVACAPNPRRQSEHAPDYAAAFAQLKAQGLVYPCYCTRGQIAAHAAERDPDGAPLHRSRCVAVSPEETRERQARGEPANWRLDLDAALRGRGDLTWEEYGEGDTPARVLAAPERWGDVMVAAKARPAVYHLAVVVDDALQGVTDVARGADLYPATSIHRLLQSLLGLPAPRYRHHRLLRDAQGAKLSKSAQSESLAALRARGVAAQEICERLGFGAGPASVALS